MSVVLLLVAGFSRSSDNLLILCCLGFGRCESDCSPCSLLDKKALSKGGDIIGDQVVFNVLNHFIDKLGPQLHPSFDDLGFKNRIADFNFVCVDGVLRKVCKMLEKNDRFFP